MSDCGHTFFMVGLDGKQGEEQLILKRLDICGVPGFALHYHVESATFHISHIASGANASAEQLAADAIKDATLRMWRSCKKHNITPLQNVAQMIAKVNETRVAAGWPMGS